MNVKALVTLWNMTQQMKGTSGARAAIGVLLGLYNGQRFPMDLTDLRVLDDQYREAAIEVITADATYCQKEVHAWLDSLTGRDDFGTRFEHLAWEYNCFKRGRASKAHLQERGPLVPDRLVINLKEATL